MFDIFSKKSKITIDCFTINQDIIDLFPVTLAADFIPSWYKDLSATIMHKRLPHPTMKTCPGVTDLFTKGIVIPLWADLNLKLEHDVVKDLIHPDLIHRHTSQQWGNNFDKWTHIKIISPWQFKEKTGCKFLFTNGFWWQQRNELQVLNGMVNYKYQHTTNINCFVNKSVFPNQFTIPAGQPIVHIIPLTDKRINIKHHAVSDEEWGKIGIHVFSVVANYYKRKHLLEKNSKK